MTRKFIAAWTLVVVLTQASSAATIQWNNASLTGNWTVGSNWVGGIAPQTLNAASTDDVVVDGEGSVPVVATVNGTFFVNTLVVSPGDTGNGSGGIRFTGSTNTWNNAGTISGTGSLDLQTAASVTNTNTGTIQANGGSLQFGGANNSTINNTGGLIQAINGGQLQLRTRFTTISGGQLNIGPGSSMVGNDVQSVFTFQNTTSTNSGTITWDQITTGGDRLKTLTFNGAGSLVNNPGGIIHIRQYADVNAVSRNLEIQIDGTTSFTNNGVVNIITDGPATFAGTGETAILRIGSAAAAGFANNGTINITHGATTNPGHVARLIANGSISNAGIINVNGVSASIQLGANNFTQTAGRLFLDGDAQVNAALVNIAGGELGGTGVIGGNLSLADTLVMRIGTTNDLLMVNGNVVLNAATSVLDLDQVGVFTGPIDLVQFSGSLSGTFASVLGLPSGYIVEYGDNAISLVEFTPAPEPSSLGLLGLGGALFLTRARRRK